MTEASVKSLLAKLGLAPQKVRGQNFLCDPNAIEEIVQFAKIKPDAMIVEIGPGLGALTRALLRRNQHLISVELDRGFAKYISGEFSEVQNFELIEADALELSLTELTSSRNVDTISLIGNVPYSISTELILWALRNRTCISSGCYLMQKEFAQRIAASPGSKAYGSLSVLCSQYFDLELGPEISGDRFYPKANVISQALKFIPLEKPRQDISDAQAFEKMVRALFAQRRKTVLNNLRAFLPETEKESLLEVLAEVDIDFKRRAETIELEEFARLFKLVSELKQAA